MGSGAADIAEIVSDVRDRLPGLPQPQHIDEPDSARFRLFDSITAFLKAASQRQPLVLVLDDLHWSDKPSLMLMQFLVRELAGARLLLIGTYRDMELNRQHPLAEALAELTRERRFERVLLRGLGHDDVGRFIEMASGIAPPSGLVDAVHTQTEGNPLFVTEVVRLLVQEGDLGAEGGVERSASGGWTVRIPEGVREVIGRRLNQLSARCNEVLTVASVIGREFELRQLDKLSDDLTEDMLLDVLEEALDARVIEEIPTTVGRYQFTHALIQETLMEELSLTRRVRLHARIGEMLESLYAGDVASRAAELAHHFVQAEASLGSEKLVKYSVLAGRRALENYAYEDALSHFEAALAAKRDQPIDSETARIYRGLGQAQAGTLGRDQLQTAVDSLRRAFDYYAQNDEPDRAIEVALFPFPQVHGLDGLAELFLRAGELAPPRSSEAGLLLAQYGLFESFEIADYQASEMAFAEAMDIATTNGDKRLEMRVLVRSAQIDNTHLHITSALEKSLRAIELSAEVDNLEAAFSGYEFAGSSKLLSGEPQIARSYYLEALALARRMHNRILMSFILSDLCALEAWVGNWQVSREYGDEAYSIDPNEYRVVSPLAYVDYQSGEFDRAQSYTRELSNQNRLSYLAIYAHIASDDEMFELISSRTAAWATSPNAEPRTILFDLIPRALVAVHQKDDRAAGDIYTLFGQFPSTSPTIFFDIVDHRLFGLLAHTMGNLDDAQSHFEDALTFCRNAGYRPELAWSLCDYADVLLERDGDGDKAKATSLLDESLQISSDLGMRPLIERVLSRREILKA